MTCIPQMCMHQNRLLILIASAEASEQAVSMLAVMLRRGTEGRSAVRRIRPSPVLCCCSSS